ncbi:MAG: mannitol dehydrogenase family protein [Propionibacteriaceae bacterium]|jgi:fructuronate reductase|nr:mannitol dehydrogenase family protein [Propionibacteriaceae bacterium]
MVRLTDDIRTASQQFAAAGITVPAYDPAKVSQAAISQPVWLHVGPGNFFRAMHAVIAQRLLAANLLDAGIVAVDTLGPGVVASVYQPFGNRYLLVVMRADGTLDRELVCSVAESHYTPPDDSSTWVRLRQIAANPALQLVTVTVTEKGYAQVGSDGQWLPHLLAELTEGPSGARSAVGVILAVALARFEAGGAPLALVSTDNFSGNGDRLKQSVLRLADEWAARGHVSGEFLAYLRDPARISYPLTMVDRITPNPAPAVAERLAAGGFADTELIQVSPSTAMAPFANTEEVWYLVIEDDFPNGRPAFEQVGVLLADRATVLAADQMKVTTCLNPLHTALAVFGKLLGFESIAAEMSDPDLLGLVRQIGYVEGLPAVADPKVISPRRFLDEVVERRFPNPNIPDTPARIAVDTSQKLPIRFGVTIREYLENPGLDAGKLEFIPLTLAAWGRYLLGVDDTGADLDFSPDPLLAEARGRLDGLSPDGGNADVSALIRLLSDVLDIDLAQTPLGVKVASYFQQMATGPGSVRDTLRQSIARFEDRL